MTQSAISYFWIGTTAAVTTGVARRAGAGWLLALGVAATVTTIGALTLYHDQRL